MLYLWEHIIVPIQRRLSNLKKTYHGDLWLPSSEVRLLMFEWVGQKVAAVSIFLIHKLLLW